jgi:mRNA-degrading endonuclease RelE of RelBE toxin-antitoxin system
VAYRIEWDQDAKDQLRRLPANRRRLVEDGVRRHLTHDAERDEGARKRTRPNAYGAWRLRLDPLRVYYDVEGDTVWINAVMTKNRSRLLLDGREVTLDEDDGEAE